MKNIDFNSLNDRLPKFGTILVTDLERTLLGIIVNEKLTAIEEHLKKHPNDITSPYISAYANLCVLFEKVIACDENLDN